MMASEALCKNCARIPFEPGLTSFYNGTYDKRSWQLGTFNQVRARCCPFCTLVASICSKLVDNGGSWSPPVLPGDDEIINVRWYGSGFDAIHHSRLGSFVCPTGDFDSVGKLCAREKLDPWINWTEVRRWIAHCKSEHTDCGGPEESSLDFAKHRFRLIDVEENCIIEATRPLRYVALSYIWGNPNDRRLLLRRGQRNRPDPARISQNLSVIHSGFDK